jgi:hypothetical protein
MDFGYEVVGLWERDTLELLAGDLGVVRLAVLGCLPADLPLEDGISVVVRRVVE